MGVSTNFFNPFVPPASSITPEMSLSTKPKLTFSIESLMAEDSKNQPQPGYTEHFAMKDSVVIPVPTFPTAFEPSRAYLPRKPYFMPQEAFQPWFLQRPRYLNQRFLSAPEIPSFLLQPFRKQKRIRTAFSANQLMKLESAFDRNHYVTGTERKLLADTLRLTETQVKVWFQNRRTKQKRQETEDKEKTLEMNTQSPSNSQQSPLVTSECPCPDEKALQVMEENYECDLMSPNDADKN